METANLATAITSFFISISCFDLKQLPSSQLYLREAIAIAEEHRLHQEPPHTGRSHIEAICCHRTLALLYVTERSWAIQRHQQISMVNLPVLPAEGFHGEDHRISAGLQCIYKLFALIDKDLIELWHTLAPEADVSAEIMEKILSNQRAVDSLSFADIQMTDAQTSDILITYQWLRLVFSQASTKLGLVS